MFPVQREKDSCYLHKVPRMKVQRSFELRIPDLANCSQLLRWRTSSVFGLNTALTWHPSPRQVLCAATEGRAHTQCSTLVASVFARTVQHLTSLLMQHVTKVSSTWFPTKHFWVVRWTTTKRSLWLYVCVCVCVWRGGGVGRVEKLHNLQSSWYYCCQLLEKITSVSV